MLEIKENKKKVNNRLLVVCSRGIYNPEFAITDAGYREKYKAMVVDADIVVVAYGRKSNDSLYKEAYIKKIAPSIYNIGDSLKCSSLFESIRSAYVLAKNI